jgi:hypothetical protein
VLDTFMALWNQNHKENRQQKSKMVLTFLFICISILLLLFTSNNFFWSMLHAKNYVASNKAMESIQDMMTPPRDIGTAESSATPTKTATVIASLPCVRISRATKSPTVRIIIPQKEGIYPVNRGKWRHPHPKHKPVKKPKQTVLATPTAQITVTPTPIINSTVTVTPTVTVIATLTPTATTTLTASPVASDTAGAITATATQEASAMFTTSFTPDARVKGLVSISNADKTNRTNGDSQGVGGLPARCNS